MQSAHLLAERESALLARGAALVEEMSLLRVATLERRVLVQEAELRTGPRQTLCRCLSVPTVLSLPPPTWPLLHAVASGLWPAKCSTSFSCHRGVVRRGPPSPSG